MAVLHEQYVYIHIMYLYTHVYTGCTGTRHVTTTLVRVQYSTTNIYPIYNNKEVTITHMMQCQIRNTNTWKSDLQKQLIKSGLGPYKVIDHLSCTVSSVSTKAPNLTSHIIILYLQGEL
jgi:hypothetical protein